MRAKSRNYSLLHDLPRRLSCNRGHRREASAWRRAVLHEHGRTCMLVAHRRELLLDRLARDGRVVAKDVAEEFGLSEDSIRRDLRDLAAAGLCQRVYGGALPLSPAVADYASRTSIAVDGKARIAALAADLVRPGSTVILDGGTTTLAVAGALPPDLEATVVTHSPTIAV